MDTISEEKRSYIMSRIRSKNTKPETVLRSILFSKGYRYRLHRKDLPGKPDLVFPMYKTVVFVHGCFWHLHNLCRDGRVPKSKLEYWEPKLKKNVERDKKNITLLIEMGGQVIVVWECEIKKDVDATVIRIESALLTT